MWCEEDQGLWGTKGRWSLLRSFSSSPGCAFDASSFDSVFTRFTAPACHSNREWQQEAGQGRVHQAHTWVLSLIRNKREKAERARDFEIGVLNTGLADKRVPLSCGLGLSEGVFQSMLGPPPLPQDVAKQVKGLPGSLA